MSFGTNTTPSNSTGLAIAEETTFKTLPVTPVWRPLEPNDYDDFGGEISTVARNPIKQDRQRRKGVVTDLDAQAGFGMDFTQRTPYDPLTGFMFANWREKANEAVTSTTATAFVTADASNFAANDLVAGVDFAFDANNTVHLVTGTTATDVQVAALTAEATPPSTARVHKVGVRAGAGDITVTVASGVATIGSTTLDFTTLGLIPGEWIWLGGDATVNKFDANNADGWYRIASIATNAIVTDRSPDSVATETGAGKEIDIYLGHVLKNEADPANQVCKSYTIERRLTATDYQYVVGCGANEMQISIPTADKVTAQLAYIGADSVSEAGQRAGTRLSLPDEDAYNTTSNVTKLRMVNDDTGANLYTFVTEANITINNGITGLKAIGELGAFDLNFGDFMVSGDLTAYFTNNAAVDAVRNNVAVSLEYTMITRNQGWLIDIPYLTMSAGRPQVEKDEPVTIPLGIEGAAHPDFDHTMLIGYFTYLPDLAE